MRLIDADSAYTVLTGYYHHKTAMQHTVLKAALDKVETVDAIPVDWIEKYIEEMDEIGFCPEAMHVSTMMGRWREEQKEN